MPEPEDTKPIIPSTAKDHKPSVFIDYARYEKYLADADMSEDDKQEMLGSLWSIIVSFVDLGFGVHPLQQATDQPCEQDPDLSSLKAGDVISSKHHYPKPKTKEIADRPISDAAKNIEA